MIIFFLFLSFPPLITTENIWEVISGGFDSVDIPPVHINKMNYSSGSPGSRHGPTAFLVEKERSIFLFGGKSCADDCDDERVYRNDLWQFSLTSRKWRYIDGDKSSTTECEEVLFNGELFTYNKINQPPCSAWGTHFENIILNEQAPPNTSHSSILYLFGGYGNYGSDSYNGIWEFSVDKMMWRKIRDDERANQTGSSSEPQNDGKSLYTFNEHVVPSEYHCAAVEKISDHLVMHFGGTNYLNGDNMLSSNEHYLYNVTSNMWKFLGGRFAHPNDGGIIPSESEKGKFNSSIYPAARGCFASATLHGNYYLFGGFGKGLSSQVWNDLWVWNSTNGMWSWLSGNPKEKNIGGSYDTFQEYNRTNQPPSLYNVKGGTLYDHSELVFLLGKEKCDNPYRLDISTNQVWMFSTVLKEWKFMNGSMVSRVKPTENMIGGRNSFDTVFDSMGRFYVLYGQKGDEDADVYDSVWVYRGVQQIHCNDRGVYHPSLSYCECFAGYNTPEIKNDCKPCDNLEYCSGNGECTYHSDDTPGLCVCDENHEGSNCSIYQCFGTSYRSESVCFGSGVCSDVNHCQCFEHFYLDDCRSNIGNAKLSVTGEFKTLKIPYVVSLEFVPPEFLEGEFDCSKVFVNYNEFGDVSDCYFHLDESSGKTEVLNVDLSKDHSIDKDDILVVIPVSDRTVQVEIRVTETDEVGDEEEEGFPRGVVWAIVLGGSAFAVCVITCLVIFFSIVVVVFCIVFVFLCCLILGLGGLGLKTSATYDSWRKEQDMERGMISEHGNRSIAKDVTFKKKLFKIRYNEISLMSMIGTGGSGANIFKVRWGRNQICAYKKFPVSQVLSSQQKFEEFEREVELLSSVVHPNILSCFGAIFEPSNQRVGIVMEYCENGDVSHFLETYRESSGVEYPIEKKLSMLSSVADGMEYLHSRSIIHRDLKSENVLIDGTYRCKIIDFGLSKQILEESNIQTKQIGTSLYMAPEVLSGIYDNKIDVFSFGIMIFVILTEEQPYQENESFVELKVAKDPNFRPNAVKIRDKKGCGEWVSELSVCCWDHDPKARPSFSEICDIFEKHLNGGVESKRKKDRSKKKKDDLLVVEDFMVEEDNETDDDDGDVNNNNDDDILKNDLTEPLLTSSMN